VATLAVSCGRTREELAADGCPCGKIKTASHGHLGRADTLIPGPGNVVARRPDGRVDQDPDGSTPSAGQVGGGAARAGGSTR
jgi:hypothetical protein